MGQMQLWQADGLGTDKETLERVLRVFRSDGVQGIKSQQALNAYIQKLDDSRLREMYEIDNETALQLFADCFGTSFAARKYSKWENDFFRKAIDILEKEKETAGREAEENRRNYEAKICEMEAEHIKELDAANEEYDKEHHEKEELKRKVMELEITLARYKADLYDFYAQAGKLPSYERG